MKNRKVIVLGAEPSSLVNFRMSLIQQLILQGYDVHVAAGQATADQIELLTKTAVKFHPIRFARAGMNPFRDGRTFLDLYKLFKSEKPYALISYTSKPNIYGSLSAKLAGVQHRVVMITGLGYTFIEGKEFKRRVGRLAIMQLYRYALTKCSAVLFQNPDDKNEFQKLRLLPKSIEPSVVNGSGVETEKFSQQLLPANAIFLVIARLLVDKGIREFAAAAQLVRQHQPDARFQILGALDPSPNSISKSEVDSWSGKEVEYLGETHDVRPFIAAASVVVLPSYREGTPRSVLEGMAMGRAVVTTDVPGCRETVVEGLNGFMVPPRNVVELAAAMTKLAGNPELRKKMGDASRKIAVDKYDATAVARDTIRKAGL